ncbi:hypothetical protein [Ekhidna sp. To15]|uniref:hypothetical protein n=1 Tax=Ekhidna sp. To15 TaxID=3395267 RepID=UPI003F5222B8
MKKILWIILLIPSLASAQELDSLVTDTTEIEPPAYYLAVYVDAGASFEASAPESNFFSVLGIGAQYEKWMIGFYRYDFQGTSQSLVVFPNSFELKYRYAGVYLGYQFYQNELLNVSAGGSYNKGDAVWRSLEDGQDFLRDEFDLIKMRLKVEIGKIRYIKPHASIGYQKMRNLNLANLNESNFSGLFVAAGIRIGYFNQ